MNQTIAAHYDGKVLVLDEPVTLPVGHPLRLSVEIVQPPVAKFADLLQFAANLPDAPADLAAHHDHYLYGTLKQ